MIELLLACYAGTFVLCDAEVTAKPRAWVRRWRPIDKLLGCYFCTGFWVSLGLAGLDGYEGFDLAIMSLAGATTTYAGNVVLIALERWTDG